MAYAAGDYRVVVRGENGTAEQWNNTWAFEDLAGAPQDPQDVVDILHTFYEDITGFASWLSDDHRSIGATIRDLAAGVTTEASWSPAAGSSSANQLPTQLAMRLSFNSALHRGGPFLTGFVVTAVGAGGVIATSCLSDFNGAFDTFMASLDAADWALCIDRPTGPELVRVTRVRVGQRWDVIRKRANELSEVYQTWVP